MLYTEIRIPSTAVYSIEIGLHEMLLQSEHRTLVPEEADFFYVPVSIALLLAVLSSSTLQSLTIHG